jgi:hypothetical protein
MLGVAAQPKLKTVLSFSASPRYNVTTKISTQCASKNRMIPSSSNQDSNYKKTAPLKRRFLKNMFLTD